MKISSCKAKGRKAVAELRKAILAAFPHLEPEDITMVPTSVGGEDLKLSPRARKCWPFSTEVKCKESLNIWAAIQQARANSKGRSPAVTFRRNHHPLWVAVSLDVMLELLCQLRKLGRGE